MRLEHCIRHVLDAITSVFQQFGVKDLERASIERKEELVLEYDVTTIVGLTGAASGNVAFSCSEETAKKLASMLMMGTLVSEMNEIGRGAIAELFQIVAQNAAIRMAQENAKVQTSQPSVIVGKDVLIILTFMSTYCVKLRTPFGLLEVSFAVEL